MEREPLRQQHHFNRDHRHAAPGNLFEDGQHNAGEHIRLGRPAPLKHPVARLDHVRRVDVITDQLERPIGLDGGGDVAVAIVEQRPAAVVILDAAQIVADLGFLGGVDLVQIMAQEHIFGRDR